MKTIPDDARGFEVPDWPVIKLSGCLLAKFRLKASIYRAAYSLASESWRSLADELRGIFLWLVGMITAAIVKFVF